MCHMVPNQKIRFVNTVSRLLNFACNTASALAREELEDMVDVPVIDVVQPGARMAAASTKNNKIGVIGTQSTIKSGI